MYLKSCLALASGGVLTLLCGHTNAQAASELYVGAGGGYALGPKRYGPALDVRFSSPTVFDGHDLGGLSPFGYVGARVPFKGVFVGLEAEFMRRDISATNAENYRGHQDIRYGTTGAYSASFKTRLLNRSSLSAVVSAPIGKIEGYLRAGIAYSDVSETFAKDYPSPAAFSEICSPPDWSCNLTYIYANPVYAKRSKGVVSPILAAGIQIPFGSIFARLEAEAEFMSLPKNRLSYTQSFQPAEGVSISSYNSYVSGYSDEGFDMNLRLSASIGAKF